MCPIEVILLNHMCLTGLVRLIDLRIMPLSGFDANYWVMWGLGDKWIVIFAWINASREHIVRILDPYQADHIHLDKSP